MRIKKKNPLAPNAPDCCHHENDHDNPAAVRELVHSDGVSVFAVRQCGICNVTAMRSQPAKGKNIQVFFDWENDCWEPVSKHGEYQARLAAKCKGPDEPTDIIEG